MPNSHYRNKILYESPWNTLSNKPTFGEIRRRIAEKLSLKVDLSILSVIYMEISMVNFETEFLRNASMDFAQSGLVRKVISYSV